MRRQFLKTAGIGAIAALTLAACGGDDHPIIETTSLRAVHASATTPAVDIYVNGARAVANVSFGAASGFASVPAGATRVQVTLAGQPASSAAIDVSPTLAANRSYTAIAIGSGTTGATRLQAALIDDDGAAPASGQAKLRVLHGAPAVPAVDIFVTAPDAALPATPTIAGLAFAQQAPASGQAALSVAGGDYRIRARVAGQTAIAFDSGRVTVPAGADWALVAVPDAGPSNSPIQLLLVPRTGNTAFVRDARANLRVAHFSPNVPAVDVFLKAPGAANSASNRVLSEVTFPQDSGFLQVPAGTYDASVALAGTLTGVLNLNGAKLDRASNTSVFAVGLLNGTGDQVLQLKAFTDDSTPVSGKAKVRVIHLSPDAPAVDVVVLAGGAIAARPVTNLAYPTATATSLQLDPGTYTLAVVPAGASTPVLPTAVGVPVTLAAGDVKTIAAVGALNATNGQSFRFVVLDDK
ncbi:MAG: DUF4397 domain-containing protein [Burkholderiales bacterium]|jgi:hypothetical protein|nr:DUF4397 domain-containing protein [Burkholderiales bacterium]